jgi:hypothetical protein
MINGQSLPFTIFEYCTKYLVSVSSTKLWDAATNQCDPNHPQAGATIALGSPHRELVVPSFQRGIEWAVQDLESCIESQSSMLGIAVIGQVSTNQSIDYLLDGLQRFSAFTSLLAILDRELFTFPSNTDPNPLNLHPDIVAALGATYVITRQHSGLRNSIYYNDVALQNIHRQAVSTTYKEWRSSLEAHLKSFFDQNHPQFDRQRSVDFVNQFTAFIQKPLFVQQLYNFPTMASLLQTFKGLNTIRVELTAADVCRSTIVDGMLSAQPTAQLHQQVLHVDNRFNTDLLTNTGKIKRPYSPLIKVLESDWESSSAHALIPAIFTRPPIASDIVQECDELLDWLNNWLGYQSQSAYVSFLADIGDNPYVATLLYYFHYYKSSGGPLGQPPDSELHEVVLAYVRRSLDGTVGDTLAITKKAGKGGFQNLSQFLDAVNPQRSGSRLGPAARAWLENALVGINGTSSAQIVFNATLLPKRHGGSSLALGSQFTPVEFGRGANKWQVDHLIPENSFSARTTGIEYRDTLRNFCPVLGSDNGSYKATDCSVKLDSSSAFYSTYLTDARKFPPGSTRPHSFISTLLTKQSVAGGDARLNQPKGLAERIGPGRPNRCFGEERLEILCDLLIERL